ncbi:hypothetical protein ACHHYP_02332 [Achlya hypogyna]|uniref:Sfi1 spindle body domain-containing protein n=1 Tax=Achlya hypogyna TaxID=1202772 RepID=A0A1V9Z6T7_ACHHY|nr:hypothetical protein ACHHYP_02332 [Achlya hypogyna]
MSSSSSDERELYRHMQATMHRRRPKSPQVRPMAHPPRFNLAVAAPARMEHALREDTQQNLVALYYWRQKQTSKFFELWRRVAAIEVQKHKTLQAIRASSRQPLTRHSKSILLQRHKQQYTHAVPPNDDEDSSDDASVWSCQRPPIARRRAQAAPESVPATDQDERRRRTLLKARSERRLAAATVAEPETKSRYTYLSPPFRRWRSLTEKQRPEREARLQLASDFANVNRCARAFKQWRGAAQRKHLSTVARRYHRRRCLDAFFRGWAYVAAVHRRGAQLHVALTARTVAQRWAVWVRQTAVCQRRRVLVFYLQAQLRTRRLHSALLVLSTYAKYRARIRWQKDVASAHVRKRCIGRAFGTWRTVAAVDIVAERLSTQVLLQRAGLRRWRQHFVKVQTRRHETGKAVHWHIMGVQQQVLRQWRRFLHLIAHRRYLNGKASRHASRQCVQVSLASWRAFVLLRRREHAKTQVAYAWSLVTVRRRSFRRWRQTCRDILQARAALLHYCSVTISVHFQAWKRVASALHAARWRVIEMEHEHACRRLRDHLLHWRDTTHQRRYWSVLAGRFEARWRRQRLMRNFGRWRVWATVRGRHRLQSTDFLARRSALQLQQMLQTWHTWAHWAHARAVRLHDIVTVHLRKTWRVSFNRWRFATASVLLTERMQLRRVLYVFGYWSLWAKRRRRNRQAVASCAVARATHALSSAWRCWVIYHCTIRRRYNLIVRAYHHRRKHVGRHYFTPWVRYTVARLKRRRAAQFYARSLLRATFARCRSAMIILAAENARRRAADVLLCGRLWSRYFRCWHHFTAYVRHAREQDAIAQELQDYHRLGRTWKAWHRVRHRRRVRQLWPSQWQKLLLARTIRTWNRRLHERGNRQTQSVAARRYFAVGCQRRVLYEWHRAMEQRRGKRLAANDALEHQEWYRAGQSVWGLRRRQRRVFAAWVAQASWQRRLRQELAELLGYRSKVLARHAFQAWVRSAAWQLQKRAASEFFLQRSLVRRALCELECIKAERRQLADAMAALRAYRCCWRQWHTATMAAAHKRRRLALAVRNQAWTVQDKCFQGWAGRAQTKRIARGRAHECTEAIALLRLEHGIRAWAGFTRRQRTSRQLHDIAHTHCHRSSLHKAFEYWVIFRFEHKERQLQLEIAVSHSNYRTLRSRFERWMEFSYLCYQRQQAQYHYESHLLAKVVAGWVTALLASLVTPEEEAAARNFRRQSAMRSVWRQWRHHCMQRLQERIACMHAARQVLARATRQWRGRARLLGRLRQAAHYFDASSLLSSFRQWRRAAASRKHHRAKCQRLTALRVTHVVRHWLRWTDNICDRRGRVQAAATLARSTAVRGCFGRWHRNVRAKVTQSELLLRVRDYLSSQSARGVFDHWRLTARASRAQRNAMAMAECHWLSSKQRLGLNALRVFVEVAQEDREHDAVVGLFTTQHLLRRSFAMWTGVTMIASARHAQHRQAVRHFALRCLGRCWKRLRQRVAYVRQLHERLYGARHVYFSSLSSRCFARLRKFAVTKRRLRHFAVSHEARLRQSSFQRWQQFRLDAQLDRHRTQRALKLYRRSRQRHWFAHWRSVACERWMRCWLVGQAHVLRAQLSLLHTVRRWHQRTLARQAVARATAAHRRPLDLACLATALAGWQHMAAVARRRDALAAATASKCAARHLRAWLVAFVHRSTSSA